MRSNDPPLHPVSQGALNHALVRKWRNAGALVYGGLISSSVNTWRVHCDHGNGMMLVATEDGDEPIYNLNVVDLGATFAVNYPIPVYILAGQCEECGNVHWAIRKQEAREAQGL